MAKKNPGWRADDGTEYPSRKEAERHDALQALSAWFDAQIGACPSELNLPTWLAESVAALQAADGLAVRPLVPLVERKRKAGDGAAAGKAPRKRGRKPSPPASVPEEATDG